MASIIGYSLIAIGIILLLFTFLVGYGLYQSLNSEQYTPQTTQSSNITSSISSLTNSLGTTAKETGFIFLQIILLFLFANIGYKFVYLGIKMNGQDNGSGSRKESK
jgi:hypothetical protein